MNDQMVQTTNFFLFSLIFPEFATCPICLTDLRDEGAHRLTLLACGHYFGRSCLMAALEISPNCPVCGQAAHDQLVQVFGLGLEEARLVINNFQMENQQLRALLDAGEGNNAPLVQYIANQLRNAMIGLGDAISGIQIFGQNVIGNWIAALEGLSGALRVMMELQQAGGIGNEVQEGGVEIEAVGEDEGQEAAGLAGQVVGPDADVAWRGHVVFVRFLEGTSISYNILFDALKFAGWIQVNIFSRLILKACAK
jgi:hypothetical protein